MPAPTSDVMYRLLVQSVTDYAIYMLTPEGLVANWNAGAERAKGYTADEIVAQHFSRFYQQADRESGLPQRALDTAKREGRFAGEGWRVRKDGTRFWAYVVIDPIYDDHGQVISYAKITRDMTEKKVHADRVEYLASHDLLTELPNREAVQQYIERCLAGSGPASSTMSTRPPSQSAGAVLYIDLDRFKPVNDSLGHSAGDQLLLAVARRLQGTLRTGDMAARVGGDEFVVFQRGCRTEDDAAQLAARIVHALNQPFTIDKMQVQIGASIGISLAPRDGNDPDMLLRNADLALYGAKLAGKNCYRSYSPALEADQQQRQELERDLREALRLRQFELHYQPVVDLVNGRLTSVEALLRWNCPERGLVPPAEFIPFAEEIGLMPEIGEWVLRQATSDAMQWSTEVRVSVNISATQFRRADMVETILSALHESGLPAERLELEVTETAMIQDVAGATKLLQQLRALGVHVALDDFGTGYSSLSFVRILPFTRIKIDRSFIAEFGARAEATAIVRAVAGLCSSLGVAVTAEGVETEQQAKLLMAVDAMEGQGYWISHPRPARDIPNLIVRLEEKESGSEDCFPYGKAGAGVDCNLFEPILRGRSGSSLAI